MVAFLIPHRSNFDARRTAVATLLWLLSSGCGSEREPRLDPENEAGSTSTGNQNFGGNEGVGGSGGEAPVPPAGSVCLQADVSALPADFAPYTTSCATSEPFACVEDLGCGLTGVALNPQKGFLLQTRLRISALDNLNVWPPNGANITVGAHTVGTDVESLLKLGYGAAPNGDKSLFVQTDSESVPSVFFTMASLSVPTPPKMDIELCYDGFRLSGLFRLSSQIALGYGKPLPSGSDRVELLFDVTADPGVDVLGRFELLSFEQFEFGEKVCGEAPPVD